jgi:chromosome segregation ATPase
MEAIADTLRHWAGEIDEEIAALQQEISNYRLALPEAERAAAVAKVRMLAVDNALAPVLSRVEPTVAIAIRVAEIRDAMKNTSREVELLRGKISQQEGSLRELKLARQTLDEALSPKPVEMAEPEINVEVVDESEPPARYRRRSH